MPSIQGDISVPAVLLDKLNCKSHGFLTSNNFMIKIVKNSDTENVMN